MHCPIASHARTFLYAAQIENSVAELMQAIDEGATSFLTTEYKYVGVFMVRVAILQSTAGLYRLRRRSCWLRLVVPRCPCITRLKTGL